MRQLRFYSVALACLSWFGIDPTFTLADEGEPNPLYTPFVSSGYGPSSMPGSELVDIVFVIDGSGSITSNAFVLQKEGIKGCITGNSPLIPHNGTVAIRGLREDWGQSGERIGVKRGLGSERI